MRDFKPTHEFRGLELEQRGTCGPEGRWYADAEEREFVLPNQLVTKLQPKPMPGEVWKYVGYGAKDYPLVLVTIDYPKSFVNEEGDTMQFLDDDHLAKFEKVLNADGSRA